MQKLLHAQARWPSATHLSLWPYALRTAVALHNTLPTLEGGISQLEQLSSIRVGIKLHELHVFGAPVFALSNKLALGSSLPKWSLRCQLGIHLGPSNEHALNFCLVLNPNTGLVSPQYHCRFCDNAFRAACEQGGQRLTFCGVNAHFQNGRAEKEIRDLSESAHKQLLHAQARWPSAIHLSLWPYALRTAVALNNTLPTLEGGIL